MKMKCKILSILDTTKKKVGAALLCGALVTTISTETVFAANAGNILYLKLLSKLS